MVWFEDLQREELTKMIILDAFEVKVVRETDGEEFVLDKKVEWDLASYTPELI